ncbi:Sin3 associated polypeptide p18-domain-containing protein [Coprinopsis sp. MPI-PUGE-AT-0042]|nr:Sin3 associated polypeptide p18-domain-containing protein [Coprinopsis sp. MPI-PUGE-AT-0042]
MDVDIDPVSTPLDSGTAMDIVKGGADAGVTRDKTTPFLIRAFVKVGGFHRLNVFEDGALPTADEHQVFTWKDATLRELLTTLRDTSSPASLAFAELKHPLARFSFKALYADSSPNSSGHKSSRSTFKYTTKELGMVYSRDILGEPGSFSLSTGATTAPRLLQDEEQQALPSQTLDADDTTNGADDKAGRDHDKTLEDLRFVPGDYMLISIILPKSALATPATAAGGASVTELNIKGANATQAGGAGSVGWKNAMRDVGRERDRDRDRDSFGRDRDGKDKETGRGANSSNWRGGSDPLTFVSGRGGRGRGARGGRGGGDFAGRDRDFAGRDTGRDGEIGRRTDVPHLLADQEPDPSPAPVLVHPSLVVPQSLDVVAVTLLRSRVVEDEPIPRPDEVDEMLHLQFDEAQGVIHRLDVEEGVILRLGEVGEMIRLGGPGVLFRDEEEGRGVIGV